MGPGAFSRLALMLLNPKDWMMVAPHVASPLIDCRPLKQAMRYGQVAQCNKTSVLVMSWLASLTNKENVSNKHSHILQTNLHGGCVFLIPVFENDPRSENIGFAFGEPSSYS